MQNSTIEAMLTSNLSKVQLLRRSSPQLLNALSRVLQLVSVNPGTVLFQQGQPGNTLYIVCSGEVGVFTLDATEQFQDKRSKKKPDQRVPTESLLFVRDGEDDFGCEQAYLELANSVGYSTLARQSQQRSDRAASDSISRSTSTYSLNASSSGTSSVLRQPSRGSAVPTDARTSGSGSSRHAPPIARVASLSLKEAEALERMVVGGLPRDRDPPPAFEPSSMPGPNTDSNSSNSTRASDAGVSEAEAAADVYSGQLSLRRMPGHTMVASIRTGGAFGELALKSSTQARTATVRAISGAAFLTVTRDDFTNHPQLRQLLNASNEWVKLFRGLPFLARVTATELTQLIMGMQPIQVAAGDVLLQHGRAATGIIVLQEGTAEVLVPGPKPKTMPRPMPESSHARKLFRPSSAAARRMVRLTEVGPGEVMGALPFLLQRPSVLQYKARTPCTVWEIGSSNLAPVASRIREALLQAAAEGARARVRTLEVLQHPLQPSSAASSSEAASADGRGHSRAGGSRPRSRGNESTEGTVDPDMYQAIGFNIGTEANLSGGQLTRKQSGWMTSSFSDGVMPYMPGPRRRSIAGAPFLRGIGGAPILIGELFKPSRCATDSRREDDCHLAPVDRLIDAGADVSSDYAGDMNAGVSSSAESSSDSESKASIGLDQSAHHGTDNAVGMDATHESQLDEFDSWIGMNAGVHEYPTDTPPGSMTRPMPQFRQIAAPPGLSPKAGHRRRKKHGPRSLDPSESSSSPFEEAVALSVSNPVSAHQRQGDAIVAPLSKVRATPNAIGTASLLAEEAAETSASLASSASREHTPVVGLVADVAAATLDDCSLIDQALSETGLVSSTKQSQSRGKDHQNEARHSIRIQEPPLDRPTPMHALGQLEKGDLVDVNVRIPTEALRQQQPTSSGLSPSSLPPPSLSPSSSSFRRRHRASTLPSTLDVLTLPGIDLAGQPGATPPEAFAPPSVSCRPRSNTMDGGHRHRPSSLGSGSPSGSVVSMSSSASASASVSVSVASSQRWRVHRRRTRAGSEIELRPVLDGLGLDRVGDSQSVGQDVSKPGRVGGSSTPGRNSLRSESPSQENTPAAQVRARPVNARIMSRHVRRLNQSGNSIGMAALRAVQASAYLSSVKSKSKGSGSEEGGDEGRRSMSIHRGESNADNAIAIARERERQREGTTGRIRTRQSVARRRSQGSPGSVVLMIPGGGDNASSNGISSGYGAVRDSPSPNQGLSQSHVMRRMRSSPTVLLPNPELMPPLLSLNDVEYPLTESESDSASDGGSNSSSSLVLESGADLDVTNKTAGDRREGRLHFAASEPGSEPGTILEGPQGMTAFDQSQAQEAAQGMEKVPLSLSLSPHAHQDSFGGRMDPGQEGPKYRRSRQRRRPSGPQQPAGLRDSRQGKIMQAARQSKVSAARASARVTATVHRRGSESRSMGARPVDVGNHGLLLGPLRSRRQSQDSTRTGRWPPAEVPPMGRGGPGRGAFRRPTRGQLAAFAMGSALLMPELHRSIEEDATDGVGTRGQGQRTGTGTGTGTGVGGTRTAAQVEAGAHSAAYQVAREHARILRASYALGKFSVQLSLLPGATREQDEANVAIRRRRKRDRDLLAVGKQHWGWTGSRSDVARRGLKAARARAARLQLGPRYNHAEEGSGGTKLPAIGQNTHPDRSSGLYPHLHLHHGDSKRQQSLRRTQAVLDLIQPYALENKLQDAGARGYRGGGGTGSGSGLPKEKMSWRLYHPADAAATASRKAQLGGMLLPAGGGPMGSASASASEGDGEGGIGERSVSTPLAGGRRGAVHGSTRKGKDHLYLNDPRGQVLATESVEPRANSFMRAIRGRERA